jgi:NADH:ubiquinone oxidoreductase subunit H
MGKARLMAFMAKAAIANRRGEKFIDTGFKILIVVVLAALLLAGLYMLFGDVIMPTLTQRVKELFNYKG